MRHYCPSLLLPAVQHVVVVKLVLGWWTLLLLLCPTQVVESFGVIDVASKQRYIKKSLFVTSSTTTTTTTTTARTTTFSALFSSSSPSSETSLPTELPDSLEDAAEIAAIACGDFADAAGALGRCRVDFDTSAGDETYTLLKQSTEFMQNLVSKLSYRTIPGLLEQRQSEMSKVVSAKAELQSILDGNNNDDDEEEEGEGGIDENRKQELIQILELGGRDADYEWKGPTVRVYFPDEGSAALARRDWNPNGHPNEAKVPPCVEFSSCGGIQLKDVSSDMLVFFFCPKASESESVEELLQKTESTAPNLKLTVFVNPQLVDMGVTGFGMAGRMLRERLLDGLVNTYYLRTLQWGALTRCWPNTFSVWQEDENEDTGYKLIKTLPYLPSNPEVEDIYDIANGNMAERKSGGPLDAFGDFVNGMMKL